MTDSKTTAWIVAYQRWLTRGCPRGAPMKRRAFPNPPEIPKPAEEKP